MQLREAALPRLRSHLLQTTCRSCVPPHTASQGDHSDHVHEKSSSGHAGVKD